MDMPRALETVRDEKAGESCRRVSGAGIPFDKLRAGYRSAQNDKP
jgi:hypothetical protein